MSTRLDQLNAQLEALFANPQYAHFTWVLAVNNTVQEMAAIIRMEEL